MAEAYIQPGIWEAVMPSQYTWVSAKDLAEHTTKGRLGGGGILHDVARDIRENLRFLVGPDIADQIVKTTYHAVSATRVSDIAAVSRLFSPTVAALIKYEGQHAGTPLIRAASGALILAHLDERLRDVEIRISDLEASTIKSPSLLTGAQEKRDQLREWSDRLDRALSEYIVGGSHAGFPTDKNEIMVLLESLYNLHAGYQLVPKHRTAFLELIGEISTKPPQWERLVALNEQIALRRPV